MGTWSIDPRDLVAKLAFPTFPTVKPGEIKQFFRAHAEIRTFLNDRNLLKDSCCIRLNRAYDVVT